MKPTHFVLNDSEGTLIAVVINDKNLKNRIQKAVNEHYDEDVKLELLWSSNVGFEYKAVMDTYEERIVGSQTWVY